MKITTNSSKITYTGLPKFQTIVDNRLIRGRAVSCPWRLYKMKQEGITQIIDLRNTSVFQRRLEKIFTKLLGIKYINYKYPHRLNTLPESTFFNKVNQTILDNSGKTYIHCQYGKRRTGICVAIYEKLHTKKTKEEIIDNIYKLGFQELKDNPNSFKIKKLQSIFNDFMKKYYND